MKRFRVTLSDGSSVVVNADSMQAAMVQVNQSPAAQTLGISAFRSVEIPSNPLQDITPGQFGGDVTDTIDDSFSQLYGLTPDQANTFRQDLGNAASLDPNLQMNPEIEAQLAEERRLAEIERQRLLRLQEMEDENRDIAGKDLAGFLSQLQDVKNPEFKQFIDLYNFRNVNFERRLIEAKVTPDGTYYRKYQYVVDGKPQEIISFLVNRDNETDKENAYLHEVPVTDAAFESGKPITTLAGDDFLLSDQRESENTTENELSDVFKRRADSVIKAISPEEAGIPGWLNSILTSQGRTFKQRNIGTEENPKYTYEIIFDDGTGGFDVPITKKPEEEKDPEGPKEPEEILEPKGPEGEEDADDTDDNDVSGNGDGSPAAGDLDGTKVDEGGNITEVTPVVDYPGDALRDFFSQEGFSLPRDNEGNEILIDRLTVLPGFPVDFLDPSNLFVQVTEVVDKQTVDPDTGEIITIQQTEKRFETNPAVSAALELYGRQLAAATNVNETSSRLVQAQISASGGLLGPASTLSPSEYEAIETNLRGIASSGGRLATVLKEGEDGLTQLVQELTPLGKQELTQEALRQSGGLLGGYFTQNEEGKEVFQQGLDPAQLLANQNQQELARIQAQNLPDLVATRFGALEAQNQRRAQLINQITGIYQNPAQLAAIVQAGGGPLLQLQDELRRTTDTLPGIPAYAPAPVYQPPGTQQAGTTPLPAGTSGESIMPPAEPVENVNLDPTNIIGYADGVPITSDGSAPFSGDALVNTATGRTTGLPLIQEYNPNLSEQAFNQLNPIQQQQAYGSAAVFGKTPEEVQEDLLDFTPMSRRPDLYGVGGTSSPLRR